MESSRDRGLVILVAVGCALLLIGTTLVYWRLTPVIAGVIVLRWHATIAYAKRRDREAAQKQAAIANRQLNTSRPKGPTPVMRPAACAVPSGAPADGRPDPTPAVPPKSA